MLYITDTSISFSSMCSVSRIETVDGDYMFCFDNTFSAVSEKLIFFELILDNMDTNEDPDDWKEYVHGTDMLDMKLEDIMVRTQPVSDRPPCYDVWFKLKFSQSVFVLFSLGVLDFVLLLSNFWEKCHCVAATR